jgi:hypothetical protein
LPILDGQVPDPATVRSAAVRLAGRRKEEAAKEKVNKSKGKTELEPGEVHKHVEYKFTYTAKGPRPAFIRV